MLVVFGDGLSDDGAEISNDESHGFLRNSNGPIWAEYLKQMLQCEKKSIELLLKTDCLSLSTIVLMNLPDLSSAPGLRFAEDGQLIKDTFAVSIAQINTQIRALVQNISRETARKRTNLRLFDLNSAMFKAIGPLNTTEPFSYQKPETSPRDMSSYAYHDLWHPTTIVHYDIAKELVTFLEDT
ncbi:hypothetical protein FO519_007315 [Halicephalobus sp. NKZ332]|nr:hypothetical protein FO519_007315 [Halicephalobus sp. NKZ332]